MITPDQPITLAPGSKPKDQTLLQELMLDIIRQRAALADLCTHLQVACDHVQNPFARFYLRDVATDIRVMSKRLEPARLRVAANQGDQQREGRMTKAQLEKENASMRIAIEAACGCYLFEEAKGILRKVVTHVDLRRVKK